MRILSCVLVTLSCLFPLRSARSQTPYSQGDPTAEEQYLLELINRARANPSAEGPRLVDSTDPQILEAYTYFKLDKDRVISDFKTYSPKPPLALNAGLSSIARRHSQYMINENVQDHSEANANDSSFTGAAFTTRIQSAVANITNMGENVYAYVYSPLFGHTGLLADWGVPSLEHRIILMSLPFTNSVEAFFNQVGIGLIANAAGTGKTGPLVLTEDFAYDSRAFLTGVIYKDANQNGFYDPGEGLAGVTVRPSSGNNYAVTSASGGYSIPIDALLRGSPIYVTASGGAMGSGVTKLVTTTGQNLKLDFNPVNLMSTKIQILVQKSESARAEKSIAKIVIKRTTDLEQPLVIHYVCQGDGMNGVDYQTLSEQLELPPGSAKAIIKVHSLMLKGSGKKTLQLTFTDGAGYSAGGATAKIIVSE